MEELHGGVVTAELAEMSSAVHEYLASVAGGGLGRVSDADVLAELRELEVLRRRLAAVDHALVGELDRRGVAGRLVMGSTAAVLQGLLRPSPGEAADRVAAARACGTHTSLTGESVPPLLPVLTGESVPPLLPVLADAQADGVVSGEHTRVILKALSELPAAVGFEDRGLAEKHLVDAAAALRPRGRSRRSAEGSWPICTPTGRWVARRSSAATGPSPCARRPTAATPPAAGSPRPAARCCWPP
jgi:hypothetical protein